MASDPSCNAAAFVRQRMGLVPAYDPPTVLPADRKMAGCQVSRLHCLARNEFYEIMPARSHSGCA
jgi:hypothetical protein